MKGEIDEIPTAQKARHCTSKPACSPTTGGASCINKLHLPRLRTWALALLAITTLFGNPGFAQSTPEPVSDAGTTTLPLNDTAAPAVTEPAIDRHNIKMQQIAAQAEADDTVWLDASNGRFLGLYERDRSGDPQGAVLILHAEGEHLDWAQSTQFLRLNLPEWGWATLTIELPEAAGKTVAKRPEPAETIPPALQESTAENEPQANAEQATQPKETPEDNKTSAQQATPPTQEITPEPEPPEKANPEVVAQERLQAALNYLHQQGQFNLALIGSGVNAARAAYFIQQLNPNPKKNRDPSEQAFQTLILLNARNTLPKPDPDGPLPALPKALHDPELPIMDVYSGLDFRDADESKERRNHARQKKFRTYKQLQLPVSNVANSAIYSDSNDILLKRLRGFLQQHMRGMELPNSKATNR